MARIADAAILALKTLPGCGFVLPAKYVKPRRAARSPKTRLGCRSMDLSIVIPVRNEAENIAPLVAEIRAALDGRLAYEIVYVDDGSDDATAAEIAKLAGSFAGLRVIRHARSCGQSAAIRTGI